MRPILATAGLAVVLLVLLAAPASAQIGGWEIERFDATITVDPDGVVHVVEEIHADFTPVHLRGIIRTFPVRYELSGHEVNNYPMPEGLEPHEVYRVLDVDGISVSSTAPDDTKVTRPSMNEHDLQIRIGDENVRVTGRHTYVIRYRVDGAMNRFDDVDELAWNVTGGNWVVPIREATATVTGPSIVQVGCAQGRAGSANPCDAANHSETRSTFRAGNLQPGEQLTVFVGFERGLIDVAPPNLVPRWSPVRAFIGHPMAFPLTGLTALLGFGAVGLLAYRQGRDRVLRGGETVDGHLDEAETVRRPLFTRRQAPVEYRPPDDLRPGQLGVLIDERVNPVDVSATIVDLAVRGHLTIEETSARRALFFTRDDWTLRRASNPEDDRLQTYEALLLDGLFSKGAEVTVSELRGTFAERYQRVEKAMYSDAVKRGWFASRPDKVRSVWLALGILATMLGGGAVAVAFFTTTFALAAVPLFFAGIALTFAHRWMPHRTPKGSKLLVRTLGFREFIRTAEADRMEFAEQENLFMAYLPYAVVFGAVDRWAAAFAHLGAAATAAAATWYIGSDPSRGLVSLSSGLSDFSTKISSTLPTTPASSGSGGGGGFSGGGGSSGGGFGGGGGGGW